ncbi:MAG TPA: alpha/beta hydrolase [Terriglobia bacterium]|nr:alpha/beta hydrolase [Terriglobia bacterium]
MYVRIFEKRLVYYPKKEIEGHPRSTYEDVIFPASDGLMLHGWFLPNQQSPVVLIVNHGNAGNISDRYEMGEYLVQELGVNVLMYDYRGYGKSEGRPSEEGTYSDIRGAYTYVRSRGYAPSMILLLGQSLGTAIAVDLATHETVGAVILEAPFTSIGAVARRLTFGVPIDYILTTRYDSRSKASSVHAPVAVIHANRDPVIPFDLGMDLYQQFPGPKRFFEVQGEIHEGALLALGVERTRQLKEFVVPK